MLPIVNNISMLLNPPVSARALYNAPGMVVEKCAVLRMRILVPFIVMVAFLPRFLGNGQAEREIMMEFLREARIDASVHVSSLNSPSQ